VNVTVVPAHTLLPKLEEMLTDGIVLFTAIVNVSGVPVHVTPERVRVGVSMIVAVTFELALFTAVKEPILPVPVAASPMDGRLLVHGKVVPGTVPENVMAVVAAPLHKLWLLTGVTFGVGFTEEV